MGGLAGFASRRMQRTTHRLRPASGCGSVGSHPLGGKPIPLGTNREAAIRKVLDLNGVSIDSDAGTVNQMWRLYQDSDDWKALSQASRDDYTQSSKKLLPVFGKMRAASSRRTSIATCACIASGRRYAPTARSRCFEPDEGRR